MRLFKLLKPDYVASFLLAIFLLAIFWRGATFIDPDFGWHLKTGELIVKSGIPASDPFSYTMPGFPYVDHSWATDVFMGASYPYIGMVGLSFVFSLLFVTTIFILWRISKTENLRWYLTFTPIFLTIGVLGRYFLVRPQVLSWLFASCLFFVLSSKTRWTKYKFFLPILFLLWVNSHGGFVLGLGILGAFGFTRLWETKKVDWNFIIIFLVATATSFINPYGTGLWREVGATIFSGELRTRIVEWMPAFLHLDLSFVMVIALWAVLLISYKKHFTFYEKVVSTLLLVSALASVKQVPFWVLFSAPLVTRGLFYLTKEAKSYKKGVERAVAFLNILCLLSLTLASLGLYLSTRQKLTEDAFYPKKAVGYLINNASPGEIFSEYGWGGYLIWKYPEKKVFIDGRMAIWKQEEKPGNLTNSFATYTQAVAVDGDIEGIFNRFNIDTVLWPVAKPPSIITKISEVVIKKLGLNSGDGGQTRSEKLQALGFQKVYADDVAEVYRRSLQ